MASGWRYVCIEVGPAGWLHRSMNGACCAQVQAGGSATAAAAAAARAIGTAVTTAISMASSQVIVQGALPEA